MKRLYTVALSVIAMSLAACGDSSTSANGGRGSDSDTVIGNKCSVTVNACPETLPEGSVCDARDGQVYKTVTIGTQTWTAQNANYCTGTNWCYENKAANCEKYGRLYTWEAAKSACPAGYHLPSTAEWNVLSTYAEENGGDDNNSLRSKESWTNSMTTPGADLFGFNGLASGDYYFEEFQDEGFKAYFWTSEEDSFDEYGKTSLIRSLSGMINSMGTGNMFKDEGISVRCVKD